MSVGLARLKKSKVPKKPIKNITHISYIYFWKFHSFAPRGAGRLKPSNMELSELISLENV